MVSTEAAPVTGRDEIFDPFNRTHTVDPFPHLTASRAKCPVVQVHENVVVVATAALASEVLRDTGRFSNHGNFLLTAGRAPLPEDDTTPPILVTIDSPAHTALRAFHQGWFTPKRIREQEPRIRLVVADVRDRVPADRGLGPVQEVAVKIPPRVLYAVITARRESGERADDILDAYLYAEESDTTFSDFEIIGNLLHRLLVDPNRWDEVRADRLHRPGPHRHHSFGQCIHLCLGGPLARLEASITLNALLDLFIARCSVDIATGALSTHVLVDHGRWAPEEVTD